MNLNREEKLESALRRLLDVTLLEVSCFEQSDTYRICNEALTMESKELYVFTYRAGHTDEDIIKNWESGDSYSNTKRYTLNEFTDLLNDEKYPCAQYYMRFIKM